MKQYFFVSYFWKTVTSSGHGSCTVEQEGFLNLAKTKELIYATVRHEGHELGICVITNFIKLSESEYKAFNAGAEFESVGML